MTSAPRMTTLFPDIGGVLLAKSWNHNQRKHTAEAFRLDLEDI